MLMVSHAHGAGGGAGDGGGGGGVGDGGGGDCDSGAGGVGDGGGGGGRGEGGGGDSGEGGGGGAVTWQESTTRAPGVSYHFENDDVSALQAPRPKVASFPTRLQVEPAVRRYLLMRKPLDVHVMPHKSPPLTV